jgi:hypothetical protein
MSRPPKPSHLHEISGAYARNPQRRGTGEPVPREGIGTAPESVSCDFAEVWDELVQCVCPGVLGNSDRIHLELTTRLLCEYRQDTVSMTGAKYRLLQNALGKLGMNPSDRTRLAVLPEAENSPEGGYF